MLLLVSSSTALNKADHTDDLLTKRRREFHGKELAKAKDKERASALRLVSPSASQLAKKKGRSSKPTDKPKGDSSDSEADDTMAAPKMVKIKKTDFEQMKEAVEKTIPELEMRIGQFQEADKIAVTDYRKLNDEHEALQDEHETLQQKNTVLIKEKDNLSQLLKEAYAALKDGGKHSKNEEKKCITDEIKAWLKSTGFVKVKFAKDEKLKTFVGEVYEGIKDRVQLDVPGSSSELSKSEFQRIYEGATASALADRRSYTQTGCYRVCQGK